MDWASTGGYCASQYSQLTKTARKYIGHYSFLQEIPASPSLVSSMEGTMDNYWGAEGTIPLSCRAERED